MKRAIRRDSTGGDLHSALRRLRLYPAPLRGLLMRVAMTDLFRARWTDQIHEEWISAVLRQRKDLTREQLERTRTLMNAHVRDCLVSGYEQLIDALELPDPNDRHVLAAAIRTRWGTAAADTMAAWIRNRPGRNSP